VQGQAKAKAEGRYKGRPEDAERNEEIRRMTAARLILELHAGRHGLKRLKQAA
jgi:hypothetical protein